MDAKGTCTKMKDGVRNNIKLPPPLHPSDQWVAIGTGNYYKGEWNHWTMSGYGVYVIPNGNF
jgi:hypothetical protein